MIKIYELKKISDKISEFLFELRNRIYVRENSLNTSIITIESHKLWIKKFFKKKNKLFIISSSNKPIGYVRLELINNIYKTSWALYKKYHKRGYAKKSLIYATKNKKYKYKALIKKKNLVSLNLAKIVGFKLKKILNNVFYLYKN